jgi:integrase
MKLTRNPTSKKIFASLATGRPEQPRVRLSLGTRSIKEAEKLARGAKLSEIEAALKLGQLSAEAITRLTHGRKITTADAVERWLAGGAVRGDSESTTTKNRAVLEQWFAWQPKLRKVSPLRLEPEHFHAFLNQSGRAGAATRRRWLAVFGSFCRYLADNGLVTKNPLRDVSIDLRLLTHPQREGKEQLPFTPKEISTIVQNTDGFWRAAVLISHATALRLSDVVELEWACFSIPGHVAVWTMKRDKRVLLPIDDTITPGLAVALRDVPPNAGRFLFPSEQKRYADVKTGRPWFSVTFGRILERLELKAPGKSFHSIRHTAISRWANQGFELEACALYAGHSSTKTTKGYVHR